MVDAWFCALRCGGFVCVLCIDLFLLLIACVLFVVFVDFVVGYVALFCGCLRCLV